MKVTQKKFVYYEPLIGLEIHCQLKTNSKMFCSCPNTLGEGEPNTAICPVCLGFPGVLPVPNKKAIEWTLLVGLALNCRFLEMAKFDRKHYFYPDLPKAYQISQYDLPFCQNGFLVIELPGQRQKRIRIRRIHLEEDAAKLIHPKGTDFSLVDFNRAGTPLLEIVTEPDLSSAEEAATFMESLQRILRYLEVSDADMEKGQLRCDANISLAPSSSSKASDLNKVEIKNLNSFKALRNALQYEIDRQIEILTRGGKIIQETRGFNEAKGKTITQRSKEEAHDYRYFPEPDIPPFDFSQDEVWNLAQLKAQLPELPQDKRERFIKEYGLSSYEVQILVADKDLASYYENVCSELLAWEKIADLKDGAEFKKLAKMVANWIATILLGLLSEANLGVKDLKISPENFAELMIMLAKGVVSRPAARQIFLEMFKTGQDPSRILEDKGLHLVSDTQILEDQVQEVVKANQQAVEDFQKGKEQALQFLIGQVMAKIKGAADPKLVKEIILRIIKT